MRTERIVDDAPFSNADLVRNSVRIALYTEFSETTDDTSPDQTATPLLRWQSPVSVRLIGEGVRPGDLETVSALTRRLQVATGQSFEIGKSGQTNVRIAIYGVQERAELLKSMVGSWAESDVRFVRDWTTNDTWPCVFLVYTDDDDRPNVITRGLILVKDELTGLMRDACFHEELTQAMGLLNDHLEVRPSMFNDDEEFAFLTEHDEFLLRILYHPKLGPNMNVDEVRPLLPEIVAELRPEE